MKNLFKEWQKQLPRYTPRELIDIFPEARERVEELVSEKVTEADKLGEELLDDLTEIMKIKTDEFSKWFVLEIIKVLKGSKFDDLSKEIMKLKTYLIRPKPNQVITPEMIMKAKNYSWELLMDFRDEWAKCPFHKEKKPSFHLWKSVGHCFGCNWHGDTIKFLIDKEGLTFQEAVLMLQ